jgi:hypothetical protein
VVRRRPYSMVTANGTSGDRRFIEGEVVITYTLHR